MLLFFVGNFCTEPIAGYLEFGHSWVSLLSLLKELLAACKIVGYYLACMYIFYVTLLTLFELIINVKIP